MIKHSNIVLLIILLNVGCSTHMKTETAEPQFDDEFHNQIIQSARENWTPPDQVIKGEVIKLTIDKHTGILESHQVAEFIGDSTEAKQFIDVIAESTVMPCLMKTWNYTVKINIAGQEKSIYLRVNGSYIMVPENGSYVSRINVEELIDNLL